MRICEYCKFYIAHIYFQHKKNSFIYILFGQILLFLYKIDIILQDIYFFCVAYIFGYFTYFFFLLKYIRTKVPVFILMNDETGKGRSSCKFSLQLYITFAFYIADILIEIQNLLNLLKEPQIYLDFLRTFNDMNIDSLSGLKR